MRAELVRRYARPGGGGVSGGGHVQTQTGAPDPDTLLLILAPHQVSAGSAGAILLWDTWSPAATSPLHP